MRARQSILPVWTTVVCAVLLAAATAWAQSGPDVSGLPEEAIAPPKRTVLRFLTDSDYPPYNYFDEDQVLTGFNVSVARAICLELDVTCEINAASWSDLLPALERGEADAVIASIAKSPETLQRASFSIPYHYTPARFAVRRETETFGMTPDDLSGRKIAVVAGTAHEAFLRTYFPDADTQTFATSTDAFSALRLKRTELLFGDAVSLALWMNGTNARGCCIFRGEAYNEPLFFGDGVAIAARKNNHEVIDMLNDGIRKIRKSRRLEEIFLQFFPLRVY